MGMLIIFVSAGVLTGLIFLNIESLKQISGVRQMMVAFFCMGIYILIWWYVFWRLLINLKISPNINTLQKSAEEIRISLINYFSQAKSDNGQYFDVIEIDNGLQVSWNKTIDFSQLVSYGSNNINYKVSFVFDENKHRCEIYTSIIRISKNVGIFGLFYSMNWNGGVIYEVGENYFPSFNLDRGNIIMDIKRLSYNNATIIDPVIEILKMSGWTSVFLIFKHKFSRAIYSFSGWTLLLFSIILMLFGSLGFIDGGDPSNVVLVDGDIFLHNDQKVFYDVNVPYYRVKEDLSQKGWLPIIPSTYKDDYATVSTTTATTITNHVDTEFPEISRSKIGTSTIYSVYFKKDSNINIIYLKHSASNEGWFVIKPNESKLDK